VPFHSEAAAFAEHHGFAIDGHVLAGRRFDSLAELEQRIPHVAADPPRPNPPHPGEVSGISAETDRAALGPLPTVRCHCARRAWLCIALVTNTVGAIGVLLAYLIVFVLRMGILGESSSSTR
jgi:hypothetical protein